MNATDTTDTQRDLFMSGTHVRYETWFGHIRGGVLTGKYIDRPTERFWEVAADTVDICTRPSIWISTAEMAVIYN